MKILLIHNFYRSFGGEDTHVIQMKDILQKRGQAVVTYFSYSAEIDGYSVWRKARLPFRNVFSVKTYREIIRLVKEERPDLAQVYHTSPLISPSVYFALKKMAVPTIQVFQNFRFMCPNGLFLTRAGETCERCKTGNFIHAVRRKCYRNSYLQTLAQAVSLYVHRKLGTFLEKTDLVVTTNEFSKTKFIESGLPPDRIMTINGFIDVPGLEPAFEADDYFVYMGRLSREKGLHTLLKAVAGIPGIRLKIMGDGPIRGELEDCAAGEAAGKVEFLGYIEGQRRFDILRRARAMVLPSECYDTFPFSVLESFALGTPVIGSRIGGLSEQIEDSKNGLLFSGTDELGPS
jgi:glycosyltransferase involved in cell wall biosynthesis